MFDTDTRGAVRGQAIEAESPHPDKRWVAGGGGLVAESAVALRSLAMPPLNVDYNI